MSILGAIAGVTLGAMVTGFSFAGGAEGFRYVEDKLSEPKIGRAHNRIDKNMKKEIKGKGKEKEKEKKEISLKELEEAIK